MDAVVRAKFVVQEKADYLGWVSAARPKERLTKVTLTPVCGKGNEQWSSATPSGKLEICISNPVAVDALELGKEYYIDFVPVEG